MGAILAISHPADALLSCEASCPTCQLLYDSFTQATI